MFLGKTIGKVHAASRLVPTSRVSGYRVAGHFRYQYEYACAWLHRHRVGVVQGILKHLEMVVHDNPPREHRLAEGVPVYSGEYPCGTIEHILASQRSHMEESLTPVLVFEYGSHGGEVSVQSAPSLLHAFPRPRANLKEIQMCLNVALEYSSAVVLCILPSSVLDCPYKIEVP